MSLLVIALCALMMLLSGVRAQDALQQRSDMMRRDDVNCGGLSTGNWGDIRTLIGKLDHNGTTTVSGGSCYRVGCINTSGIYVDNAGSDVDLVLNNSDIVSAAADIGDYCCMGSEAIGGSAATSGKLLRGSSSEWNVCIGYADCTHPDDTCINAYTVPGPNGDCIQFWEDGGHEAAGDEGSESTETDPGFDEASMFSVIMERQNNNGQQFCGVYSTGDMGDIGYLLYQLSGTFTVPGSSCLRVACRETTGIYVNNDSDYSTEVSSGSITAIANNITSDCCTFSQGAGPHLAISGQQFVVDTADWNVCLGYANCNDPDNSCLSQYGSGPGPNGACQD